MAHTRKRHKPWCAKSQDDRKRCNCDGSWQARIPDPDCPPGGTKKLERCFVTRKEAEDWIALQQASVLTGTYVDPRRADRPFQDVLDAWRESWPSRLAPTTRLRYDGILRKYVGPTFANLPISAITHERVQRYMNVLSADETIAPGTVRNVHAVMRTACASGVRLNRLATNPTLNIDLPRRRHEEMLFLTSEEVSQVAEKIDPHYRVLVYVAAYTGLRAGELAGLQRRDVDLLRAVINVRRAVKDINGRLELGDTKTHAQRTVSLPAFLKEMLREHLTSPVPGGTGPEAYVFTGKGGGPLRMSLVYSRYFRRTVAGWTDGRGKRHPGALPEGKHGLRFHDLRHTCAALSVATGAHPKLISARLGHSSIQVTLDRYGHLFPSMEESLADALDAAFAAQPASEEENVKTLRPAEG